MLHYLFSSISLPRVSSQLKPFATTLRRVSSPVCEDFLQSIRVSTVYAAHGNVEQAVRAVWTVNDEFKLTSLVSNGLLLAHCINISS